VSVVTLDHVTLRIGTRKVLADVSFNIEAGEFIGVLGPNGAGKTTLMRAILGLLGLANAGWLLLITNVALYLNYELFHFCCHVKDDRIVRYIPLVNSIRRHHIAHHNTALMMERNFNLTYPIADWFFGTSDLACGLLQHVFNGYNTRFVRRDLKRVRNTSDDPRVGHVQVAAE